MSAVKKFLAWIDGSKKAKAAVAAVLVAALSPLLAKVGWDVTLEQVGMVWGALVSYILGQGLADNGKEALKLEAELAAEDEE